MYSSSSSECEFDDYYRFENNYNRTYGSSFKNNPFYPTMGHPLIYYAQVPEPVCMKQCGRERRKDNPNCFVRAFRWYTEEHVPHKIESLTNKPNKAGFAAWLDEKYEQYLEDVQNPNLYHMKMKETALIETDNHPDDYCEPCIAKRFHVKSPWRKKRRARSNETAVVLMRSSHSFQYLLQPKDHSAHASEYGHSSTTTVKTEYGKKTLVRSQSYSYISVKDEEPLDVVVPQEGAYNTNNVYQKNNNNNYCKICKKPETKSTKTIASTSKVPTRDFGCQFPAEKITRDKGIQSGLDSSQPLADTVNEAKKEINVECECPKVTPKPSIKDCVNNTDTETQCNDDKVDDAPAKSCCNESTQNEVYCECPEQTSLKQDCQTQSESLTNECGTECCCCSLSEDKHSCSPVQGATTMTTSEYGCTKQEIICITPKVPIYATEGCQTSDYNIRLEREAIQEYPFFMKIVCADKLC